MTIRNVCLPLVLAMSSDHSESEAEVRETVPKSFSVWMHKKYQDWHWSFPSLFCDCFLSEVKDSWTAALSSPPARHGTP